MMQGPAPGQIFPILPDSSLTIGRLPDCGVASPEDLSLSRLHAIVERRSEECWLANRSSNGTFVNDESVDRVRLREGDVIKCAQLALKYWGAKTPETAKTAVWDRPTQYEDDKSEKLGLRLESTLPNGWNWLHPDSAEAPRQQALNGLCEVATSALVIIDWRRAAMDPPDDAPPGTPLFHWLPPESAKLVSPMILPWNDGDWSRAVLDQACGKDAVLWVFSDKPPEEAISLLHRATGYGTSSGMLGFCWPSVLVELFKHPGPLLQPVLEVGNAWLVDQPETWHLAATSAVCDRLRRAWNIRTDAEPAATHL
jgi:hypothetical protein